MPDISMCQNKECPSKNDCLRFTAKPNEIWQSYAEFDFGGRICCEDYIPNKNPDTNKITRTPSSV